MKSKKIIAIVAVVIVSVLIGYGYMMYRNIFSGNTKFSEKEVYVNIPTGSDYEAVKKIMTPYVDDMERFNLVAEKKSYPQRSEKAGRFLIKKGMNSNDIIGALRVNIPVDLTFNNQERLEDFAGRIGAQIESDSVAVLEAFKNPEFLKENELTEENVLSICIPNSYEIFWNTNAEKFRDRMIKEYRKFWNDERVAKAKALNLTPIQATVIASIVHKETVKKDERPRVAGVYLNRYAMGMKLEADPTVIYAVKKNSGDWNQVIKRVLNKDLVTDSPYNTYMYATLPPGPIAMPDITAIDGVLNPEKHNYIYFCASVTNFGYHEFAVTGAQHERNRQKYVAWINAQGVKR